MALDLAGVIHAQAPRGEDPPFIPIRLLDILGATPVSILRRGGCCSGLTRLYITGLATLGIKAAQVTLYHAAGQAQHCLAEVSLGEQRVLVDPFVWVLLRGYSWNALSPPCAPPGGSSPNTEGFRTAPTRTTPRTTTTTLSFRTPRPPTGPRRRTRRTAYTILMVLTAGRIDTLRQPLWMEWPQLTVAAAVTVGVLMFNLAMLFQYGSARVPLF